MRGGNSRRSDWRQKAGAVVGALILVVAAAAVVGAVPPGRGRERGGDAGGSGQLSNVAVTDFYHGILAENVSGGTVRNVTATGNGGGVVLDDATGVTVADSTVADNGVVDSGVVGVVLGGGALQTPGNVPEAGAPGTGDATTTVATRGLEVRDNEILDSRWIGLYVRDVADSTFEGNDVSGTRSRSPRSVDVPAGATVARQSSGNAFASTRGRWRSTASRRPAASGPSWPTAASTPPGTSSRASWTGSRSRSWSPRWANPRRSGRRPSG